MNPKVLARIALKPSIAGGRQSQIARPFYPFRVKIGSDFYDARAFLDADQALGPGDEKELTVKFLDPDSVIPQLAIGDRLPIWEIHEVGHLFILDILH